MNQKRKNELYNPFNGAVFDDGKVWDLDHQLAIGKISFEEYKKKIAEL